MCKKVDLILIDHSQLSLLTTTPVDGVLYPGKGQSGSIVTIRGPSFPYLGVSYSTPMGLLGSTSAILVGTELRRVREREQGLKWGSDTSTFVLCW